MSVFFMSSLSPQSFQTCHLKVSKSFYRNKVSLAYVLVTLLICIAQSFRHDLLVKHMLWWLVSFLNLQARAGRGFLRWCFPDLTASCAQSGGRWSMGPAQLPTWLSCKAQRPVWARSPTPYTGGSFLLSNSSFIHAFLSPTQDWRSRSKELPAPNLASHMLGQT